MKNILLILLLFVSSFASAQKKELLLTLKEDEEISVDYTQIIINAEGVSYRIVTEANNRHYEYTKTVKGKMIGVDTREGEFITTGKEDGKNYFRVNSTGKKYGPEEDLRPRYDEEKQILYGYSYKKGGMNYFVDLIRDKSYGPLLKGGLWFIDENNLIYSYSEKNNSTGKDEVFLIENAVKNGPYEQVAYYKPVQGNLSPLMIYRENGKFFTNLPKLKGVSFASFPIPTELKNGWMMEGITEAGSKDKKLFLPDGTKLDNTQTLKHSVNFTGDILKLEFVAGGGSDAAYKVTFKGKEIGTFAAKKSNRSDLSKTDFFDQQLIKVEVKNNHSLAFRNVNYFFSPSHRLIGPYTEKEIKNINFYNGGYAIIREDSTFEMNGKKILDKIVYSDFRGEDAWWAFQQRGDYVYPYKDGVEVPVSEIPKRIGGLKTENKEVIKVQRGNEFYLRVKGSDKLLGPVEQYNSFVVSKDGKHYAEERGSDGYIVVNKKPVTKGFNVVFNDQTKTFYWFIQEENKVYMYTYKLP